MTYVLSDIHGNKDAFDSILAQINMTEQDHLYILGDVVDRGSDSLELLQGIRKMPNTTLLLGNHYLARKRAEGKHYNVALSHAVKKLVRLIFALQRSGRNYAPVP